MVYTVTSQILHIMSKKERQWKCPEHAASKTGSHAVKFSFTKSNRVAIIEETTKAAQYYAFILDWRLSCNI